MKTLCIISAGLALASVSAYSITTAEPLCRRILHYGWNIPDTQFLRGRWREVLGLPFDGVGVKVAIDRAAWADGEQSAANQLGWQVMGGRRFHIAEFRGALDDLERSQHAGMPALYLPVVLSSRVSSDVNWFDDSRWRVIANNFSVAARIAAETARGGLILDPEHYGVQLFNYEANRRQSARSFEEYAAIAKRRGRQVMAAISEHLPQPEILSLFAYSLLTDEMRRGVAFNRMQYGLLGPFYDGLLEAAPKGTRMVEGYEFSYSYVKREEFRAARTEMLELGIKASSAGHAYVQKVKIGFGIWPESPRWPAAARVSLLGQAIRAAFESSDCYVWVYTQQLGFFPPDAISQPYIDAIRDAKKSVTK